MNDLRSPLEDRPYRQAIPQQTYIEAGNGFSARFGRLRQHRFFPLGSVLLAVVVFGGIISYAYNQGSQSGVNATTPVIQASNTDYKSKPANPGGMDVPFQDAVVFDQLQNKQASGGQQKDTVESLLPAPEQPAASTTTATVPTATATTNNTTVATTTSPPSAATEATPSTNATTTTPATPATTAPATTSVQNTTPTPATTTATTPTKSASSSDNAIAKKMAAVAPASTTPTAKIATGNYRIQLGAFRDQAAAKAAWNKMKNQYHSQLASVTPAYPEANLGAKGTFYRVQGINLSKATAQQLCTQINTAKSGSCIVTK